MNDDRDPTPEEIAKFVQAMGGRYDPADPKQAEALLDQIGGKASYDPRDRTMRRFGSRDDRARAKLLLAHLKPDAVAEPEPSPARPTTAAVDAVENSVYSVALEKQIALRRWLDQHPDVFLAESSTPIGFGDAARSARDCRRSLEHGNTYYFAAHLLAAVEASADTMPDWTFGDHMIGPYGFFWFARPLRLPAYQSHTSPLAAISWSHDILNGVPARNFFFWTAIDGEIFPSVVYTWAAGELRSQVLAVRAHRFFQADPDAFASDEEEAAACDSSDARDGAKLSLLSACVAFIDQRIFTSSTRAASRAVRRRHRDLKHEPLIRVIELRRKYQHTDAHAESEHRDWACQWIVRGHWRQQWYPKLKRHQPKWITPYVKGPEDRPLKEPRATIFAVVR